MSKHMKEKEPDSVWFRVLLVIVIVVWAAIALGNLAGNYLVKSKFFNKKTDVENTAPTAVITNVSSYQTPEDYGKNEEKTKCATSPKEKISQTPAQTVEKEITPTKKIVEENKKTEKQIKPTNTPQVKTEQKTMYKLQAGFFSDKDNAAKAVNQIKSFGYSAYMINATLDGKSGYKVFVGSYKNKENAEKEKENLKAKGIDVIIVD